MFFGVNIIGTFFSVISWLFMSSSSIDRYDFKLAKDDYHTYKFTTTNLNVNYWLDKSTKDTILNLETEKPSVF